MVNGGHKTYYIFDIVYFKESTHPINILGLNASKRLEYAMKLLPFLKKVFTTEKIDIQPKTFFYSGDLAQDTKSVMRYMSDQFKEKAFNSNDGIIYTPIGPYEGKIYKFKFPSLQSIDFQIINETISDMGKFFDVQVADKHDTMKHQTKLVPFKDQKLLVSKNNPLYNIIEPNLIVESIFDIKNNWWLASRPRYDKTNPNFITVANDVYHDIIHPIYLVDLIRAFEENNSRVHPTNKPIVDIKVVPENNTNPIIRRKIPRKIEPTAPTEISSQTTVQKDTPNLSGKIPEKKNCLEDMRRYNNLEKFRLLNTYINKYTTSDDNKDSHPTVLDIGFGRGGDIHKYEKFNIAHIWGVEPNSSNIKEAEKRLAEKPENFRNRVEIIETPAQNTVQVLNAMDHKYADITVSFFSLTFFFQSEEDLDKLVNTVSRATTIGGFFYWNYNGW